MKGILFILSISLLLAGQAEYEKAKVPVVRVATP